MSTNDTSATDRILDAWARQLPHGTGITAAAVHMLLLLALPRQLPLRVVYL
jgi:hypothetical protein